MNRTTDETFFQHRQVASIAAAIDAVQLILSWINDKGTIQLIAYFLALTGLLLMVMAAAFTDQQLVPAAATESSRSTLRIACTVAALIGISAPWWVPWMQARAR